MDRKRRMGEINLESMRRLAEERALASRKEANERKKKEEEENAKKKQEAMARKAQEELEREERRARVYAVNAVMAEIARRQFAQFCNEMEDEDVAVKDVDHEDLEQEVKEVEDVRHAVEGQEDKKEDGAECKDGMGKDMEVETVEDLAPDTEFIEGGMTAALSARAEEVEVEEV